MLPRLQATYIHTYIHTYISPIMATVGVNKNVPERCKHGTGVVLRVKDDDFQPTKKWCLLLRKAGNLLNCYRWKTISKGYVCSEK